MHSPPSGPVKPASQVHSAIPVLPGGDDECAGHARQHSELDMAIAMSKSGRVTAESSPQLLTYSHSSWQ